MEALVKPSWLKIKPPTENFKEVKKTLESHNLVTVCQEAHCPNISECWSGGTATFMILGDTCTRGCQFCAIKTAAKGKDVDPLEPFKLGQAIKKIGMLDYVVLTSVDRDDLPDQGAEHFAKCIKAIKKAHPSILVEVLTPDFQGREDLWDIIIEAKPDVIAHNIETVERLTPRVRDRRATYKQSLRVLKYVKSKNPEIYTKSSIMVGLGEEYEEVMQVMEDLRSHDVDIVTFGQYLKPRNKQLAVKEYVKPETFEVYKQQALKKGFAFCASGPFVRSSYRAGELFLLNKKRCESE